MNETDMTDRTRLLELLRTLSFSRRKVILTSGRESDFFIDCKQAVLTAEGHALVGTVMLDAVEALKIDCVAVAGVALGGCSLASSVSLISEQRRAKGNRTRALDAIYVRKEAKGHGSQRLIEGGSHLPPESSVVILEDTTTTGGSTCKAIANIRNAGFRVHGVVTLVDRLEGARAAIEAEDVAFSAIFTRRDFMND